MGFVHEKHFTLEEARAALAEVKASVEELARLKQALDGKGFDVQRHEFFGGRGPNGDRYFPRELERLVEILRGLDARGIQVKGIEDGLIDFPHVRSNGEEVYLCHRIGEPDLAWWHPIETGFAGRRPIEDL